MISRDPQILEIQAALAATFRRTDSLLRRAQFLARRIEGRRISGVTLPDDRPGGIRAGEEPEFSKLRLRTHVGAEILPT